MPAPQQYTGGCHCGAVRYEADVEISAPLACNCSICAKTGYWLSFVPVGQFKLVKGEDDLVDYRFNKKVINHLFCKTCGVHSFARGTGPDGREMIAVNIRCLDGVDVGSVTPKPFNGRDM